MMVKPGEKKELVHHLEFKLYLDFVLKKKKHSVFPCK